MRENRLYGSEGGEAKSLPYPYHGSAAAHSPIWPQQVPEQRLHDRFGTSSTDNLVEGWIASLCSQ